MTADVIENLRPNAEVPLIQRSDLLEILVLGLLLPCALLLAPRRWVGLAKVLARADALLRRHEFTTRVAHLHRVSGLDSPNGRQAQLTFLADGFLLRLSALKHHLTPDWSPPVHVDGAQHIRDALQHKQGVILWIADTVVAHHETYAALSNVGLGNTHISRYSHGFSQSHFGRRYLNPIRQRIEQRAAHEIVYIEKGSTRLGIKRLKDRLSQNGVVSIRIGDNASRIVRIPFAEGLLRISAGPIKMSLDSGAPLLPVYVHGSVSGEIKVSIGTSLAVNSGNDDGLIETARALAEWLEPHVLKNPGSWRSWPIVECKNDTSIDVKSNSASLT